MNILARDKIRIENQKDDFKSFNGWQKDLTSCNLTVANFPETSAAGLVKCYPALTSVAYKTVYIIVSNSIEIV